MPSDATKTAPTGTSPRAAAARASARARAIGVSPSRNGGGWIVAALMAVAFCSSSLEVYILS